MQSPERIATFIPALDDRIGGGIYKAQMCLVCGHPGTAKTTFCYHVAHQNAKMGRKVLYISVEQYGPNLEQQLACTGFDLADVADNMTIIDLSGVRKSRGDADNWFQVVLKLIQQEVNTGGVDIVVLDSLTALSEMAPLENPRNVLWEFIDRLRLTGLTTYLVSEMIDAPPRYGLFGSEGFIVDGIFHLSMDLDGDTIRREIQVLKLRGIKHDGHKLGFFIGDGTISTWGD